MLSRVKTTVVNLSAVIGARAATAPWWTGSGDTELHHGNATGVGAIGQGVAQSCGLHLLGGALRVVTRLRAEHGAAVVPLRCTDGALTSTTGALLLPRLLAAAGNHATSLGGVGALTSSSELSGDNLVDQRDVSLDILGGNAEESLRSFNGAGGLALGVGDVQSNVCHGLSGPFTAERTRTMLPFGPGMAPLMARMPFSTSAETTVRFWVVAVT